MLGVWLFGSRFLSCIRQVCSLFSLVFFCNNTYVTAVICRCRKLTKQTHHQRKRMGGWLGRLVLGRAQEGVAPLSAVLLSGVLSGACAWVGCALCALFSHSSPTLNPTLILPAGVRSSFAFFTCAMLQIRAQAWKRNVGFSLSSAYSIYFAFQVCVFVCAFVCVLSTYRWLHVISVTHKHTRPRALSGACPRGQGSQLFQRVFQRVVHPGALLLPARAPGVQPDPHPIAALRGTLCPERLCTLAMRCTNKHCFYRSFEQIAT